MALFFVFLFVGVHISSDFGKHFVLSKGIRCLVTTSLRQRVLMPERISQLVTWSWHVTPDEPHLAFFFFQVVDDFISQVVVLRNWILVFRLIDLFANIVGTSKKKMIHCMWMSNKLVTDKYTEIEAIYCTNIWTIQKNTFLKTEQSKIYL